MRILLLLSVSACVLRGDQILLRNGDRFTGSVVRSDTKALVLQTEFAGTITIAFDAITNLTSEGPLYIGLSDRQTVAGAVNLAESGALTVQTEAAGVVTSTRDRIQSIRSKEEQAAIDNQIIRLQNPLLVDLWTGYLDLGFAANRGNANTQTITVSANANRITTRDKISVYYTSLFSSSDVTGLRQTTANSKRGGVAYNLNMSKRAFLFGSADLESDEFQNLDLRFVPAGGGGYHAINTTNTQWDFNLGASGNREFFSTGLNRNSAELLLGEEFVRKFTATTSFRQKLSFFSNVSDSGNYRVNFDMSMVTAVRRWFSWQFTVSDRYLSNPVPGRKTNDILFSTGLRLTLAK